MGEIPEGLKKIAIHDPTTYHVLKIMESAGLVELGKESIKFDKEFMEEVKEARGVIEKREGRISEDDTRPFLIGLTKMLLKRERVKEIKRMADILEGGNFEKLKHRLRW